MCKRTEDVCSVAAGRRWYKYVCRCNWTLKSQHHPNPPPKRQSGFWAVGTNMTHSTSSSTQANGRPHVEGAVFACTRQGLACPDIFVCTTLYTTKLYIYGMYNNILYYIVKYHDIDIHCATVSALVRWAGQKIGFRTPWDKAQRGPIVWLNGRGGSWMDEFVAIALWCVRHSMCGKKKLVSILIARNHHKPCVQQYNGILLGWRHWPILSLSRIYNDLYFENLCKNTGMDDCC